VSDSLRPHGEDGLEDLLRSHRLDIAGYRVHERLASGGQGIVHRGVRLVDGRVVAIKYLRERDLATRAELVRFGREVIALRALAPHPGIVEYIEHGVSAAGYHFLVMEFVEGSRLDEFLLGSRAAPGSPLATDWKLELFLRLCDAVAAAHDRAITHRDLSPSNVLVDPTGQPKLIDFGLSRNPFEKLIDPNLVTATIPGSFVGKLRYASPEQVRNRTVVGPPADVYALGVMLYEMLSGSVPYEFPKGMEDLRNVLRIIEEVSPRPLRIRTSGWERPELGRLERGLLRARLRAIVRKALSKAPPERYLSAGEMAADLRRAARGERTLAPTFPLGLPNRRQFLGMGAAGAVAASFFALRSQDASQLSAEAERPAPANFLLARCYGAPTQVEAISLHASGTLCSAYRTSVVGDGVVFDLPSGTRSTSHGSELWVFSPGGRHAFSPGWLMESATGAQTPLPGTENCRHVVFSSDSSRLAAMHKWAAPELHVFSTRNGERLLRVSFRGGLIADLDLSPDGRFLAASGGEANGSVALWSVESGEEVRHLDWQRGTKTPLRFSLDSTELCAFHWPTRHCFFYDTASGRTLWHRELKRLTSRNLNLPFATSQGFRLTDHDLSGRAVTVWDIRGEQPLFRAVLDSQPTVRSQVSLDGNLLLTGESGGCVTLWHLPSGRRQVLSSSGGGDPRCMTLASEMGLAACALETGEVQVYALPRSWS
jgi:serine/threonine protein kinase